MTAEQLLARYPDAAKRSTWPLWRQLAFDRYQVPRIEADAACSAAAKDRTAKALAAAFEAGRKQGFSESEAQRHRKDLYGADA